MSSELRIRRGTSSQHTTFIGAESEITSNTTNKSVHIHDGITAGGFELARSDLNNVSNSDFLTKANAAGVSGAGGGAAVATITAATQANPVVITTDASHGFVDATLVQITDVVGMTELNGNSYYVDVIDSTSFALYSDASLTTTIDGTGFSAYVSGGEAAGAETTGAPIDVSYITVNSEGSLPNERRLQANSGLSISDGGAGGAISITANLSSSAPQNLGSAAAGVSTDIARADHVHAMPTATDVGAVPTATQILAGTGLTGGGALTSDVTLSISAALNNLTDVSVSSAANGDVLIYNEATSRFENSQNFAKNTIKENSTTIATSSINKFNFIGSGIDVTVNGVDNSQIDIDFGVVVNTAEGIQDIVGGMVSGNTESGITVTYDDPNGKLNFAVNNPTISLTGDVTGSATMTNLGNVSISTAIPDNSIVLGTQTSGNYVQTVTAGQGVILVNSAAGLEGAQQEISLDLNGKANLEEFVSDFVGGMVSNNTEVGINIVYDDTNNQLDIDVDDFAITLAGDLTGSATVTNLSNATLTATIAADAVALGTNTTGDYVASITAGSGVSITGGTGEGSTPTIGVNTSETNFVESIQDIVGSMFTLNTESGISVVYQDADGTIDVDVDDFTITLAGDLSGSTTITNLSNTTLTATINPNSVTLGTDTTGDYVQSLVAGNGIALANNTGESATPTISVDTGETNFVESIQDIVGSMFTLNTESGVNVVYQDVDGTIDVDINDFTITLAGDLSGAATIADLASATLTATINPNSVALGTDTTGDYVQSLVAGNGIILTNNTGESATPTVAIDTENTLLIEKIEDVVGGMITGNTESGINVSYDDVNGKVNFNVNDPTITLSGDVTGSAVMTDLGNTTISCTIADDSHNHIIANVDGLQTALNDKLSLAGGTLTGTVTTQNFVPASNASFNIGASGTRYNVVYANTFDGTASSAEYADLAERYHSDSPYPIGTVVKLGGTREITATNQDFDTQVMGVISENPAYLMNAGAGDPKEWLPVALTGRVPVKVEGTVKKGQRIVASETPGVGKAVDDAEIASLLSIVGRALEDSNDQNITLVECIVGKL